jgi:hypothetical protein
MWVPLLNLNYVNESENPDELKLSPLPLPFLVHHADPTILIEQLIAEIIPVLNISVSNAATRPTSNGIAPFIFVEPVTRLPQDTHQEHVKDEGMMMESADITTLTDMKTETSPGNVKTPPVCLYLFIFSIVQKVERLFLYYFTPFSFSTINNQTDYYHVPSSYFVFHPHCLSYVQQTLSPRHFSQALYLVPQKCRSLHLPWP